MTRVTHGVSSHKRHKKLFQSTKGYRGKHRYSIKQAANAHYKAGQHAYRHRKLKKREFHQLWILRINAGCRQLGIKYSRFIYGMELAGIAINRKMLSELAVNFPEAFKEVVEKAKAALPAVGKAPDIEELKKKHTGKAPAKTEKPAVKKVAKAE